MKEVCYYCKKEITGESIPARFYWTKNKTGEKRSHPECLREGFALQCYECQCIDADCNDCKFFVRGERKGDGIFTGACTSPNGAQEAQRKNAYETQDDRLARKVWAFTAFASGRPCFVHRKD